MFSSNQIPTVNAAESLIEGEDYYWEGEAMVFTAQYHLRRGYCCDNGCRHCPYEELDERTKYSQDEVVSQFRD